MKLMNLLVDYAFKQMFGQPNQSEPVLIPFLNDVLMTSSDNYITSVQFENNEIPKGTENGKSVRLDLYVTTNHGEKINVEIQVANYSGMINRTLYYFSMIHQTLLLRGEDYECIPKLILINILDFSLFPSTEPYHTSYHLYNDESKRLLTDSLEIHFIELSKIPKYYTKQQPLLRWLLMLKAVERDSFADLMALREVDPVMETALDLWESISKDPEHWAYYISREKELLDMKNIAKDREKAVKLLNEAIKERDHAVEALDHAVEERDHAVEALDHAVEERDHAVEERDLAFQNAVKFFLENGFSIEMVAEKLRLSIAEVERFSQN